MAGAKEMPADREAFLDRWSRLKRERAAGEPAPQGAQAPAAAAAVQPKAVPDEPPPLPPLESLTPESDFSAFMHPKVPELMRRAALKKLFQDPRYNVVDKFEAYWEDYTRAEGIPPELLEKLDQARRHVFGDAFERDARQGAAHEGAQPGKSQPARAPAHEAAGPNEGSREAGPQEPATAAARKHDGARTQDA